MLARSGWNKIGLGAESGSQRILDFLNKGCLVEDTLNAIKRAKQYNIFPVVAFLTGLPTETEEEQMMTLRLIRDILKIQPQAVINGPAIYRPYPGGSLFELCVKEYGLKIPESLDEWSRPEVLGGNKSPWIKRLWFVQHIWNTLRCRTYPLKDTFKKIKEKPAEGLSILIIGLITRVRLRFLYYGLPFEFKLLDWYHRFILKRPPEFS
jgi:radical SAM superfamily enzyme YgiQ (UPF0313 family)